MTLLFLWLPSVQIAVTRVARRVKEGGHNIPVEVIRRRYDAGLRNVRRSYLPLADLAMIYDNADNKARVLVAEHRRGQPLVIHDDTRWRRILEMTP